MPPASPAPTPPPPPAPADGTFELKVNGEPRRVVPGTSVADLVRATGLPPERVAVEVNRRLVRTADYGREVKAGDAVEIVTFVGGG